MAAYNAEQYIKDAINSVINQTYDDWELIIVDDGSTDGTATIVDYYAECNSKIKVIHQKNSGTAAAARNSGLKYVSGDYIQLIDSDDMISKDLLEIYNNKLFSNSIDVLIPNCLCFFGNNINDIYWEKKPPNHDYSQILSGESAFELSLDWTIHGVFLVKTELLLSIKYDEELINGDEFTTRKILCNANSVSFADTYYYYRRNTVSTTLNIKNKYKMYEAIITSYNIYDYARRTIRNHRIIDLCIIHYIKTFCGYCKMYCKDTDTNNDVKKHYAEEILRTSFSKITSEMWKKAPLKYRIFYILSKGNYNVFLTEIKIISRFI